MPSLHEPAVDPHRRDLLALTVTVPLALVGSLLIPTPVETSVAAPVQPLAAADSQAQRGYHSSSHIDTYYSSLRY